MKRTARYITATTLALASLLAAAPTVSAQDDGSRRSSSSSSGISRRRAGETDAAAARPGVTGRMQQRFDATTGTGDADKAWMRVIYRQLDLNKVANAPLYYPVEITDGDENLFRIIMRLMMDDRLKGYEYLDGREIFDDKYRIAVSDLLDKCYIPYTEAKGSSAKSPRYVADEADIPAGEVLRYYIIEQWEFDRRNNNLHNTILAICPVLMRVGEYSSEPEPMPLCWIRYSDLRPHLLTQSIFMTDDNNLPTGTYDDFFTLGRYDGEIYKVRNLRNLSMSQMYPDPEERKKACDSIQAVLDNFDSKLWVPSLDELTAAREAREAAAAGTDTSAVASAPKEKPSRSRTARASAKKANAKKPKKESKPKASSSGSVSRSVRNRRR